MAGRGSRRRRGLRVLLWASAVFMLAQLAGGLVLDFWLPDIRFPEAGRAMSGLLARPRSPEIVFMGSSRLQGAARPDVLDPLLRRYTRQAPESFNASVGAGDPIVAERLLERLLDAGRRPALLVVEISPEQFNRRTVLLGQQVLRQMTWADLPDYLPDACLYSSVRKLATSRLVPLYVHRYQVRKVTLEAARTVLSELELTARAAGAGAGAPVPQPVPRPPAHPELRALPPRPAPLPRPPADAPALASPAEFVGQWLRDYRLSPVVTGALERLLERCRAERIEVLLVGAPVMAAHRALYDPAIEATYRAYVGGLIERYGCRFVECRDHVPDEGFGDPMHVSGAGAEFFTRRLARETLVPLWRELRP